MFRLIRPACRPTLVLLILLFASGGLRADDDRPMRMSVTINPANVPRALLANEALGDDPDLRSRAFLVVDQRSGEVLLERNAGRVAPIASITKLMTAMVVIDGRQSFKQKVTISKHDVDTLRHSSSRLPVGTRLSRGELLRLALMSSENRAASALARSYPGGTHAFVKHMNRKARALGLRDTHFVESTGLSARNVSSPRDLARLATVAAKYPLIRTYSTEGAHDVTIAGRARTFRNTNALVRDPDWEISLSKTGYIREAGRCLVMQTWLRARPLMVVLMDSMGRHTRTADARRLRDWLASRPWDTLVVAPVAPAS